MTALNLPDVGLKLNLMQRLPGDTEQHAGKLFKKKKKELWTA